MSEHVVACRSHVGATSEPRRSHVRDVGVMSEYVGVMSEHVVACRSHVGDMSEESDVASVTCRRNTTWDWMTNRIQVIES
jgi:hypothetical protein